jgi:hypothetical protein
MLQQEEAASEDMEAEV